MGAVDIVSARRSSPYWMPAGRTEMLSVYDGIVGRESVVYWYIRSPMGSNGQE